MKTMRLGIFPFLLPLIFAAWGNCASPDSAGLRSVSGVEVVDGGLLETTSTDYCDNETCYEPKPLTLDARLVSVPRGVVWP